MIRFDQLRLYTKLLDILARKPLLWGSENDFGVMPVMDRHIRQAIDYVEVPDAHTLLMNQAESEPDSASRTDWLELVHLLYIEGNPAQLRAFQRPTGNDCEYELCIGYPTQYDNTITGIYTLLIQS